jgi:hypothetical protein
MPVSTSAASISERRDDSCGAGLADPGHALNAADRGDIADEIEVSVALIAADEPARPSA